MNILADENIEAQIIVRLRDDGHDVVAIAELQPGISDVAVLQLAIQHQLLLLTGDKDFGDILFFRHAQTPIGVVLIRLPDTISAISKAALIADVLKTYAQQIPGSFTVISVNGVRVTPLPTSP
jgi:predicted nuclease of predicted toxin-antitoxin system